MSDSVAHEHVRTADDTTFQAEVMERSRQGLVVVDFWAAWCAPCRMLGPILEELAQAGAGRWTLVKVDTEQAPNASMSFGVSSIPAVFAVRDGAPIDGFVGVLPKEQIQAWLERLLPTAAQTATSEARALLGTDPAAAERQLRTVIESSPGETAAIVALAEALLRQDKIDEATEAIAPLEERELLDAEGRRVAAEIKLRGQTDQAGDLEQARTAAEAAPKDGTAQIRYAQALAGAGDHAAAMEVLLHIVRDNLDGRRGEAKDLMLELFALLGDDAPLVHDYRRQLSTALY